MDSFFASVEVAQRPELRGKPVVVVGGGEERSAVSAASYEAKAIGIKGGMSVAEAKRICPDGAFIQADLDKYIYVSGRLVELFEKFTPIVEPSSIDEAYLDITGTERIFGHPENLARDLKKAVREEMGLTASVGIAPNKTWAKIACEMGKPDGLAIITKNEIPFYAEKLPADAMPGVGKSAKKILEKLGINTIAQIARYNRDALERLFGKCGPALHDLANGIDNSPVIPWQKLPRPKSLGCEFTFPKDISNREELLGILAWLTETVFHRLRSMNAVARTVQLKIRLSNFETFVRRKTIGDVSTIGALFDPMKELLHENIAEGTSVRLIGVSLSGLTFLQSNKPNIENLFDNKKSEDLSNAVEAIKRQYGADTIRWGRSAKWLSNQKINYYH